MMDDAATVLKSAGRTFGASAPPPQCQLPRPGVPMPPEHGFASATDTGLPTLERFAHHSSDAIWVADAHSGAFSCLNLAACRWWAGVDPVATLDEWQDRLHPLDRARVAEQRRRVGQGEPQRLNYRLTDGRLVRRFRETSFLIPCDRGGAGSVAGIVEYLADDVPLYVIGSTVRNDNGLSAMLVEAGCRVIGLRREDWRRLGSSLQPGCLCIDARGGLALLDKAAELLGKPPFLSALIIGATPLPLEWAADLIEHGQARYIAWPASMAAIERAIDQVRVDLADHSNVAAPRQPAEDIRGLPRREQQVLAGLMRGGTNKSIARELGLSPRTVEVHRAHMMERLGAPNLPTLLHMAITAGFKDAV